MAGNDRVGARGIGEGVRRGEHMQYSAEVERMCPVAKGAYHGPAPIPEEGKWVQIGRAHV